jgi:acyl-CoA reductase-like NAD-dependent aldehyde dehydrogenase
MDEGYRSCASCGTRIRNRDDLDQRIVMRSHRVPFGGMKRSGVGREQGMVALDHYSEYKPVFIANN